MKKLITNLRFQGWLLGILSVMQMLAMIFFTRYHLYAAIISEVVAVLGILIIRFARNIAYIHNRVRTRLFKKKYNQSDEEPSEFAVFFRTVSGCILVFMQSFCLLLS